MRQPQSVRVEVHGPHVKAMTGAHSGCVPLYYLMEITTERPINLSNSSPFPNTASYSIANYSADES